MNLTFDTFLPLLPVILLSLTSVLVMLAIAIKRNHSVSYGLTLAGLVVSFLSISVVDGFSANRTATPVTSLLLMDSFAYFYSALIIIAGFVCAVFTHNFIQSYGSNKEEIYILLLIAVVGGLILVSSNHMASFFIGLELLSVPVYGMVAYTSERNRSLEAGIKYLILSAAASSFMLFGMALIYAQTGTLSFGDLSHKLPGTDTYLAGFGVAMIAIALCFKLSLAPFHLWTPDVYQGAPAPVGALLATVSKIAVVAVLIRFLLQVPLELTFFLQPIFVVIAIASIVVGNFLALTQNNLKRMLAYSSIAHMGYLFIPMVAGNTVAVQSINVYLATYLVTSLGAFGVISALSKAGDVNDCEDINYYRGLFWRSPWLAGAMALIMLSLAGIPLTAGFIGKFYIFLVGVNTASWLLLGALIVGSGIGLYYYLRVMINLFTRIDGAPAADATTSMNASGYIVMLMTVLVVWGGIYPQPLLEFLSKLSIN
jgi:NADH-quinone oxidoreductase subunit N